MTASAETARPVSGPGGLVAWSGYPWVVLAASLLVQTAASFGNQGISPLAPFLVDDLGLTRGQLGLVVTATYLGASFVLVLAGNLSDRFGVRAIFLLAMVGAGIPLALAAGAPSYAWLLVPMAVYGVGNGFALPPTNRAIVDWFPSRHRGLAMGVKQTGVALAGVLCGLVVPGLAFTLGWRGAVAILGLVTVVAGVLAWAAYRDHAGEMAASRVERPGLAVVVRNRDLLLLCGVTWLYAGVQLSLIGFLVLFLHERMGLDLAVAGGLLALTQAGGVIGRIGWGVVSDRFFGGRRKIVMALIGVLAACTSLALGSLAPTTPLPLLWAILLLAGVSSVGWNGINMLHVTEMAGRRASATAAGLNLTASYLGIMMGPPLFGLLVDLTGTYSIAFYSGAVAYVAALLLLSLVRSTAEHAAS